MALAAEPASGVRMVPGTEVLAAGTPDPWWAAGVPDLTRTTPPPGWDGSHDAWSFTAPLVDMPVHLAWLRERLEALGGTLTRMSLARLPHPDGGLVVNCSGLGARLLAHETDVHPARGQVLLLDGIDLDRWWLDGTDHVAPTYVVPRSDRVVVGGTFEEGDWSRTPDPATTERILRRAARLVPAVAEGRVVAQRVGLRPVRSEVRLERVADVVHCYGHGGAGVTLAQGCAAEVLDLVSR
jgi:D-amino-acid oxidase